jgi:hypothetical protein
MIAASPAYLAANASMSKRPIFIITISGYSKAFSNAPELLGITIGSAAIYDILTSIEDHQTTVNDLDGGADLADLIFTVQDRGGMITADFPSFTFEGKTVVLLQGYAGMAFSDYVPLMTSRLDAVESANDNNDYVFTCPDAAAPLLQTIYQTGDDGKPTSSSHPRTLLGHPLDILLDVLETQCGYLPSQVDEAKILTYRDTVYSGASMKFSLDAAPVAKDFIEHEILKPLGAYRRTNNLGQITVEFSYPRTVTTVYEFTPANLFAIPVAGQNDLINEVVIRMDHDGSKFATESIKSDAASITKYGLFGQQTIESKGLRSGLNGIFLGGITAFLIFLRYGNKALCHGDNGKNSSSPPIDAMWAAVLVEPGDLVALTHPQVPNRTLGVVGIINKSYVVLDRTVQFFAGHVQLKLVEIDLSKFGGGALTGGGYLITTNGEAAFTAASGADQKTYMFLCNDSDQYSTGEAANTLA